MGIREKLLPLKATQTRKKVESCMSNIHIHENIESRVYKYVKIYIYIYV